MGTGSYFDKALCQTNATLIGDMRREMKGVKYDTIVGTGLSGTIFTARVAPGLRKNFAIVRKPDDKSTHSGTRVEGQVGKRWVFADDFVSSGTTLKRVLNMMKENHPDSEFAGVYQSERGDFSDPDESAYRWGNWVTELSIGVKLGPKTLDQVKRETPWDTTPLRQPLEGWAPRFRKLLPMSERQHLTVDYQDSYGRPTLYDGPQRIRWTCEDEKALPLIEEVENAAAALGVSIRRLIGENMARLPKPRDPNTRPKPMPRGYVPDLRNKIQAPVTINVPGLVAFNDAMVKADDAAIKLMQAAYQAEGR